MVVTLALKVRERWILGGQCGRNRKLQIRWEIISKINVEKWVSMSTSGFHMYPHRREYTTYITHGCYVYTYTCTYTQFRLGKKTAWTQQCETNIWNGDLSINWQILLKTHILRDQDVPKDSLNEFKRETETRIFKHPSTLLCSIVLVSNISPRQRLCTGWILKKAASWASKMLSGIKVPAASLII